MDTIEDLRTRPAVLPPHDAALDEAGPCGEITTLPEDTPDEPEPIAAFTCVIEYEGSDGAWSRRLIQCNRMETIGETCYVLAYCNLARSLRQFRVDRVLTVADAETGETLGDGTYFARFNVDSAKPAPETWGLLRSQKALLVAGLNVLSFMARCDGDWHPLEEDTIESFVCSLWMRKEWEAEPPIADILAHARRLAPDGDAFFKSLNMYARSNTSARVLRSAVNALIAADGVICGEEMDWTMAMDDHLGGAG